MIPASQYLAPSKSAFLRSWDALSSDQKREIVGGTWDMIRIRGTVDDWELLRQIAALTAQYAQGSEFNGKVQS